MAGKGKPGRKCTIGEPEEQSILKDVSEGVTETAAFGSLGIPSRTYYDHKTRSPQFSHDIEKARKTAHRAVTRMLIKAAVDGKTGALIFWLKNRFPEEWRDVHNLAGEKGGPIQIQTQRDRLKTILGDPSLKEAAIEIGKRLASMELNDDETKKE